MPQLDKTQPFVYILQQITPKDRPNGGRCDNMTINLRPGGEEARSVHDDPRMAGTVSYGRRLSCLLGRAAMAARLRVPELCTSRSVDLVSRT